MNRVLPVLRATTRLALLLLFALGASAALLQATGQPALEALAALWTGGFGTPDAIAATLARATPLLLTGVAVQVALASGRLNIGAEGQMAVGALTAAALAAALPLPGPLLLAVASVGAMAAGGAWAWLPAVLRERRGAHEVVTALLCNTIARNVTRHLAAGPLREPGGASPQTAPIAASLPRLFPEHDIHVGLLVALAAVAAAAWWLRASVAGYETRVAGAAPDAARHAGIGVGSVCVRAFVASGALAGLAGAVVVLGETPFRRFPADFYGNGAGFDGLAVALLAGGQPWAAVPAAVAFGGLIQGADAMAFAVGTPRQIAQVIQALLLLGIASQVLGRRSRA